MPSQCCARGCIHRNDAKLTSSCTFFSLPTAKTNGKWIGGRFYQADQIQVWKRQLLQNVGYQGNEKTANLGADLRICSCHFLPDQIQNGDLVFGSLPFDAKSVQITHPPTTPSPLQRVSKRAFAEVGLSPPMILNSPIANSSGYTLGESYTAVSALASPLPAPADSGGSPLKVRKVVMTELESAVAKLSSDNARLQAENAALASTLAAYRQQSLDYQQLYQESGLTVASCLRAASEKAELPWCSPRTYVSFNRLKHDPLFSSNCKAMTGLNDYISVELLFDVCIGFSNGVLPVQYRPHRGESWGAVSTASMEEHMNFMFFVLYCIRTGVNSFSLAGMLFGFEESAATRWLVRHYYDFDNDFFAVV